MLSRWSIARQDMDTAGIARPIGRGRKHFPHCPTSLPVWKNFVGARKRFAGVPFQATAGFFQRCQILRQTTSPTPAQVITVPRMASGVGARPNTRNSATTATMGVR